MFVDIQYEKTNCIDIYHSKQDPSYLSRGGCVYRRENKTFTSGIGASSNLNIVQSIRTPPYRSSLRFLIFSPVFDQLASILINLFYQLFQVDVPFAGEEVADESSDGVEGSKFLRADLQGGERDVGSARLSPTDRDPQYPVAHHPLLLL